MKRWYCDVCHVVEGKDKPLYTLHDRSLLMCGSCYHKELERMRKMQ